MTRQAHGSLPAGVGINEGKAKSHGQERAKALHYSPREVPMKSRTFKHSKTASFFRGFASAFDLSGMGLIDIPNLNNGPARDATALRRDWHQVGIDMRNSMEAETCGR